MTAKEQLAGTDAEVRRFDYDDSTVLAADFGHTESASADVVGDTVIVVADGKQYDIDVEGDARAFIRNGILTVEVSA
jgi:hypothetical protein